MNPPDRGTPDICRQTRAIEHVFALRRSGHHAVIAWLQSCYELSGSSVIFANSVYDNHLGNHGQSTDKSPQFWWNAASSSNILITDYQDVAYNKRGNSPTYDFLQSDNTCIPNRDTVVVRDFYSVAASRLRFIRSPERAGTRAQKMSALSWQAVSERWSDHARLVAEAAETGNSDTVGVNFINWYSDSRYRERLAETYGLPNSDESLNSVPLFGQGSSFDGLNAQGNARSMKVLRRWESLDGELVSPYRRLIDETRHSIDGLNRQLFGFGYDEVVETLG